MIMCFVNCSNLLWLVRKLKKRGDALDHETIPIINDQLMFPFDFFICIKLVLIFVVNSCEQSLLTVSSTPPNKQP